MADPAPLQNTSESERALLEACARGEQAAWATLVERFSRLVYAVPRRYNLPPEACDDVFQDVFAILVKELPKIREPRTLPKWLITVAARESLRTLRKRTAHRALPGSEAGPLPAETLERLEREQIVRDALVELGDPCRTLLQELFSAETPDYAVIAARLGMPIGSIGPTRARCLQKLLTIVQRRIEQD